MLEGNACRVYLVDRAEYVMKMNVRAFREEINKDGKYIVAPEREVFEASKTAYFGEVTV